MEMEANCRKSMETRERQWTKPILNSMQVMHLRPSAIKTRFISHMAKQERLLMEIDIFVKLLNKMLLINFVKLQY